MSVIIKSTMISTSCRRLFLVRLIAIWILQVTSASESRGQETNKVEVDDNILVLTTQNFNQAIAEYEYLLVEFYAPWCGACQLFVPEYARVAKILKDEGSEIRLAKVDATVETTLAKEYNVSGYPDVKFFRGKGSKKPIQFKDITDKDGLEIVAWLKQKAGPPAKPFSTSDQLKFIFDNFNFVVVGFFKDLETDASRDFIRAADENDDVTFAITQNETLFKEYDIKTDSAVIIFRNFDEERVDMTIDSGNEINLKTITEFIDSNRLALIVEFNHGTAPVVFESTIRKHVILFMNKHDPQLEGKILILRQIAKHYKGKAIFIHMDCAVSENARILSWFNLKESDCPTTRLVDLSGPIKYRPTTDDWTAYQLKQFVQDVLDGTEKAFYVSEEIPDDWDSKPVKTLVGKNFDNVAKDAAKDVFVKFFAPWCGFCKELAPTWDELGEKYKDNTDVVIARIDATANEIEGIKITIFPTLKFFPKGSNEIKDFPNINATLERLTNFIENGGNFLPQEEIIKVESEKEENKVEKNERKEEL